MKTILDTDLILNPDGSIYHLNLLPEDVAKTVITVGDPDRVAVISNYFDSIELKKGKREFITHTGYLGKKRITVISTGIGTDNIDIVLNELDALVNIDFTLRETKPQLISLDIIRIGTSGAIQPDIEVGSIVISEYALGLDTLMQYYVHDLDGNERDLQDAAHSYFHHLKGLNPYVTSADKVLLQRFERDLVKGITVTSPGFYAPQGREIRIRTTIPDFIELLSNFR
ncbi:MAG TPA: nucleoside phosphorylase, partial [Sphingobacteriaceae bacterium]